MSGKNNIKSMMLKYLACYLAVLAVAYFTVQYAAEAGHREKLWSDIMLFVNFGVLVFIYVRFAQKPLKKFLKGEGDKISEQLQTIEANVQEARSSMEAESDKLKNLDDNLINITESIIAAGAREKESIIEKAKAIADKMVSDAKKESEFKMLSAKKRFSEEMLDAAIQITADSIKQNITGEDDERLVTSFSSDLGSGQNITV